MSAVIRIPRQKSNDHPFGLLPFVRDHKPSGNGRDWWVAPTTGDYQNDSILGKGFGEIALDYSRRYDMPEAPSLLRLVVHDMISRGEWNGLNVGFLGVFGLASIRRDRP